MASFWPGACSSLAWSLIAFSVFLLDLEIAPDIEVRAPKIKTGPVTGAIPGCGEDERNPFAFNSKFTVTAGCACHYGAMREPLPDRGSFEADERELER
jgi:hypothetical protein